MGVPNRFQSIATILRVAPCALENRNSTVLPLQCGPQPQRRRCITLAIATEPKRMLPTPVVEFSRTWRSLVYRMAALEKSHHAYARASLQTRVTGRVAFGPPSHRKRLQPVCNQEAWLHAVSALPTALESAVHHDCGTMITTAFTQCQAGMRERIVVSCGSQRNFLLLLVA